MTDLIKKTKLIRVFPGSMPLYPWVRVLELSKTVILYIKIRVKGNYCLFFLVLNHQEIGDY
ncbi:MAG: hypothetical protein BTN85_1301 [Candidatus Methanohalarchaeum thermophilum]|uniref:Uncharacterized protein n=1 Tax=Methanohalarchaeum thermophilum TaxID=1903181 RepID=A0A1Q6DWV7_METT1|nr:MAG: hypothetical protein BTN85_1301 [Candidatus Methanohalarchaeum thermophilum]